MSSAIGARVRPFSFGVSASEACSAPTEEKSSAVLRHCSILIGSNEWLSSACTSSVSNGGDLPGVGKGAVAGGAASAACDLRELGRIEFSELISVELAVGGKRDVIDVEVESHADRVGGDEGFHIPGLVEVDLRIAGRRGQRSGDHGSAAPLTADQLGDGVNLLHRERDDGGAAGKSSDLFFARKGKLRQARS